MSVTRVRDWITRIRMRSSRYALLTAALAGILGVLAVIDLADQGSGLPGALGKIAVAVFAVVIVGVVLLCGALPSSVGLALVAVATAATIHSVGFATDRPEAISGVQQIPILATYLAWTYPPRLARACGAGMVFAVAGTAAIGPFATGSTFSVGTLVGMVLFTWLCLEVGVQVRLQVRSEARTDSLTGVLNRRGFYERAHGELRHATRNAEPVTIAVLDLDDFKSVNDAGGHSAGDEVLRQVARQLKAQLRAGDTLARIGGDEFVVILPGATAVNARARLAVWRAEAVHPWSWGAAERRQDDSIADLICRADQAMYQGKHRP